VRELKICIYDTMALCLCNDKLRAYGGKGKYSISKLATGDLYGLESVRRYATCVYLWE